MQYTIKTAAILLKNKTHAIYDDNGDIKTLRKVLKKAFNNTDGRHEHLRGCFYRSNSAGYGVWSEAEYMNGFEIINLSEIIRKPKMKPETFTISKEDYDLFQSFLKLCKKVKS